MGLSGCAKAPPNLTPQATQAWYATQVVKALDLVRDTAVSANALTPPLISTDTTRKVVQYHEDTVSIIQALPSGWQTTVKASLTVFVSSLSDSDKTLLKSYVTVVQDALKAVPQ